MGSYASAQKLFAAARDLQTLNFALSEITTCASRYVCLSTPQLPQDTAVITADHLFLYSPLLTTEEKNEIDRQTAATNVLNSAAALQQMSVSALIIASGATSILESIQNTWPAFSALRPNTPGNIPLILTDYYIIFSLFLSLEKHRRVRSSRHKISLLRCLLRQQRLIFRRPDDRGALPERCITDRLPFRPRLPGSSRPSDRTPSAETSSTLQYD